MNSHPTLEQSGPSPSETPCPIPLTTRAETYRDQLRTRCSRGHVDTTFRQIAAILDSTGPTPTRAAVEAFLGKLRARRRSLRTLNHYLTSFRAFCRWCCDEDNAFMEKDPTRSIKKFHERKDQRKIRRAMTDAEVRALIAAADADVRGIYHLAGSDWAERWHAYAATGVRESTLGQLTVEQFRLAGESPSLMIYGSQEQKKGVDRMVPVLGDVERMRRYLSARRPGELAFPMPVRWKIIYAFRRHLLMADIPWSQAIVAADGSRRLINVVDVHSLRVSLGTRLALGGIPAKIAQAILGHSDVRLTTEIYQKITHAETFAACKGLPPLFPPPQAQAG